MERWEHSANEAPNLVLCWDWELGSIELALGSEKELVEGLAVGIEEQWECKQVQAQERSERQAKDLGTSRLDMSR